MQAITAIGNMSNAQVFTAGQQVFHAHGEQRSQRDLEGPATDIEISAQGGAGMQIDPIAANAYAVGEELRTHYWPACLDAYVLLHYRVLRLDTPTLADVHLFCQAILRPHDIVPQSEARVAVATVEANRKQVAAAEAALERAKAQLHNVDIKAADRLTLVSEVN